MALGYYPVNNNDLLQGSVAAEFAFNELKATKAARFMMEVLMRFELQAVFANRFQGLGGTITFQGAVNIGDTNMRTVLTSVAADSPMF